MSGARNALELFLCLVLRKRSDPVRRGRSCRQTKQRKKYEIIQFFFGLSVDGGTLCKVSSRSFIFSSLDAIATFLTMNKR